MARYINREGEVTEKRENFIKPCFPSYISFCLLLNPNRWIFMRIWGVDLLLRSSGCRFWGMGATLREVKLGSPMKLKIGMSTWEKEPQILKDGLNLGREQREGPGEKWWGWQWKSEWREKIGERESVAEGEGKLMWCVVLGENGWKGSWCVYPFK